MSTLQKPAEQPLSGRPDGSRTDVDASPGAADAVCRVCPRECRLVPGATGRCRARVNRDGEVVAGNYGRATSLALDPVEKKPLAMWRPGTFVLSVGSYGCNMACPFCQNHSIAAAGANDVRWEELSAQQLVDEAVYLREGDPRVTGLAFTYNEPLVGWEYVRDAASLAHDRGLANVLVSNGQAQGWVLRELAGLLDAANIDLKAPDQGGYDRLGGSFSTAWSTIETLAADPVCHLEVTTLVVPGLNDDEGSIERIASDLASLDPTIPLHVTRFFGRHRMADSAPTPVAHVRRAAEVARRHLLHVFVGNC